MPATPLICRTLLPSGLGVCCCTPHTLTAASAHIPRTSLLIEESAFHTCMFSIAWFILLPLFPFLLSAFERRGNRPHRCALLPRYNRRANRQEKSDCISAIARLNCSRYHNSTPESLCVHPLLTPYFTHFSPCFHPVLFKLFLFSVQFVSFSNAFAPNNFIANLGIIALHHFFGEFFPHPVSLTISSYVMPFI